MRRSLLVLALLAGTADAEPPRRVVVETPPQSLAEQAAPATVLFLNRCTGGCLVTQNGTNDARNQKTSILPNPGEYLISEFHNDAGLGGSAADDEWNQIVTCVKDVYSPYNITVTDVQPADGIIYNEAIVAGSPGETQEASDILGIAPLANNCSAEANVISFSFANQHTTPDRVHNICWTASQESAHAYGLDHEYQFTDGTSACNDPMTYRTDCGGEKFFRNKRAQCGESKVRNCKCSNTQNSHTMLLDLFGPGTPTTPPPQDTLIVPAPGQTTIANGTAIHATAFSERGIAHVELYLNGSRWLDDPGVPFGQNGQPMSDYPFPLPANLPDGVIDIVVKAYDDLGLVTATPLVTVTKGAPCTSDDQCLKNQSCTAGKCAWPTPTADLGASCTYDQFCTTWQCTQTNEGQKCSQPCSIDEPTSCPSGFDCLGDAQSGFCWPQTSGGCCSVAPDSSDAIWAHVGAAALVAGLLMRRRKR
jgi:MYXO-CTERM domain-containing protein